MPEVKGAVLIDSPINAYAINRRDFRDLRKCTVTFYCN